MEDVFPWLAGPTCSRVERRVGDGFNFGHHREGKVDRAK